MGNIFTDNLLQMRIKLANEMICRPISSMGYMANALAVDLHHSIVLDILYKKGGPVKKVGMPKVLDIFQFFLLN